MRKQDERVVLHVYFHLDSSADFENPMPAICRLRSQHMAPSTINKLGIKAKHSNYVANCKRYE